MRVSKSKILASALAAFLLLEGGMRVLSLVKFNQATARPLGESDKILVVGDSHSSGLLSNGVQASVIGQNTSELLEKLPSLFERERPRALVILSGEANFWNRRFVSQFLDHVPGGFDFLSRWKVVRLFSRLKILPSQSSSWSRFFPELRSEEYPTIAMRWVGYLSSSAEVGDLSARDRDEAVSVLQRWAADPRAGSLVTLPLVLKNLREGGHSRLPDAGNPAIYGPLSAAMVKGGRSQEAHDIFLKGLRENPFYAGGEPPSHSFHRYFSEEEFSSLLAEAMPPAAVSGEKPGLATIRESFLSDDRILEWAFHDLVEITRFARERHVPTLLLTYPPDRFSGKETPMNGVIREVAIALDAPLSDLSSELDRRWGKGDRSRFYDGDHLSEVGNRAATEVIKEDLRRIFPL
jgi:hypothetical protein